MTSISNRAILVSLGISEWTARKYDKGASKGVTARAGAIDSAARVNKALLPQALSLERVHKKTSEIRNAYYKRTLPWREGSQIISTRDYVAFARWLGDQKDEWYSEVKQFVADYPALRRDAEIALNGLYNEDDYPPPSAIADKFSFRAHFEPVPDASDWRVDVADEHLAAMKADLQRSTEERIGAAMQDAWRRIYEVVQKAHDRLSCEGAIFRNSLVENAVELCSLLPALNVTGDAKLEEMRQALEGSLAACEPQNLRDDPVLRSDVADQMADIMSKMGAFYKPAT